MSTNPSSNILFHGKYPRNAAEFADLTALVEKYVLPGFVPERPIINKTDVILTQGSCFAQNILAALQENGMNAGGFSFEERLNSPTANELFFKYIIHPDIPFANNDHAVMFTQARQKNARLTLQHTKVFIFTLGVAPFQATIEDKTLVFNLVHKRMNQYCIANPTAEETKQSIDNIVSAVRSVNPSINIVLTVSPVPLNRSAQPSSVVADCISKSTLRAAVAEYLSTPRDGIYYWPSFEIVRWLGAHLPPVFGADDGETRHVNKEVIDLIVSLFLKHFAGLTPNKTVS